MNNKELFLENAKNYFKEDYERFLKKMNEKQTHGFFLNTVKASKEEILKLVDFEYREYNSISMSHDNENIGKSKAYELGLIYPQGNEASLPSLLINPDDVKIAVDLCASPGGKSINVLNRLDKDTLLISNEYNYPRVQALTSNIERLGFENVIITNKDTSILAEQLQGNCDLVILDAPCSGEGMIRKYHEILDEYSNKNIESLAELQKTLLENAYLCLNENGQLLYSTCTFSPKEDEEQIESFLNRHNDMERISEYNKYSFLDDTEGQFFVLLKKNSSSLNKNLKKMKNVRNPLIERFIKENIEIDEYYIYKINENYYLSLIEMPDLGKNVIRYGLPLGKIEKDRFEPEHGLYRSNRLKFRNQYELNDKEYALFISGNEIPVDAVDGFIQLTYQGYPIGFGKAAKGRLKNRYPKGLRRML